ncbi:hypothetical protein A6043_00010 [[Haemophilus] ducreyi]|uniref:porin OmpA n=1 Tax=Haemophilus ducreyi TaxID=730 RepID=UPI0007CE0315|nr:porin OmpA [[Haemophilus] ducreyi]ANF69852.1 hypothetical protein A6043_00010 [[Haemophilus] ducreyi]ANF71486.1 hypothetical protein A6044_00540 [[Haemophilus] ducreyi]
MKKTLVTLAVLSATAVATAAPQADTFYVGAKAGWASFHRGINQFDNKYKNRKHTAVMKEEKLNIRRDSVTYGVFAGYQIFNQNKAGLAAELGYDYYGQLSAKFKHAEKNSIQFPVVSAMKDRATDNNEEYVVRHTAHGVNFSLKPSYELLPDLDAYAKVGIGLARNDYSVKPKKKAVNNKTEKVKNRVYDVKPSLILGAGFEYAIIPELALRVEYQYLNRVGNLGKAIKKAYKTNDMVGKYSPDMHSVSAGLSYRFGQGAQMMMDEPTPVAEPEVVSKNFAFSSDVLFDFAKADLKQEAAQVLDATNAEIVNLGLATPAIQVNGYTDRIGKEEANLKLSQRRAEMVANYLVAKGQNPVSINAVGYGEANPITGNTCDAVKGRKQLIACLAPDRRVEVQVQGTKQITM